MKALKASWLTLYTATLILQIPFAALRTMIAHPLTKLALELAHAPTAPAQALVLALGYGPLALSIATLLLPLAHGRTQRHDDARLTTALSLLTPPPRHSQKTLANILAQLWSGTLGLRPLVPAWDAYWRSREYLAGLPEPVKQTPSGPPLRGGS
ncbi:MAG TPA: hypothetical protein VFW38_03160 [Solirubrobacteraceae bacterium]|nr:hypothetical protein [Solirubrobacteraceae bacterium]